MKTLNLSSRWFQNWRRHTRKKTYSHECDIYACNFTHNVFWPYSEFGFAERTIKWMCNGFGFFSLLYFCDHKRILCGFVFPHVATSRSRRLAGCSLFFHLLLEMVAVASKNGMLCIFGMRMAFFFVSRRFAVVSARLDQNTIESQQVVKHFYANHFIPNKWFFTIKIAFIVCRCRILAFWLTTRPRPWSNREMLAIRLWNRHIDTGRDRRRFWWIQKKRRKISREPNKEEHNKMIAYICM